MRYDMLPKVRTPWALTFVGRAFALNWDRGCEAGSLSSRSVKKGKVTNKPKEQMIPTLQIKTHKGYMDKVVQIFIIKQMCHE